MDGVGFGAGDPIQWMEDKPTGGPSAAAEGDRLKGCRQLLDERRVGELSCDLLFVEPRGCSDVF